jgi:uncharacterized protein (TIGR03435 family)
MMRITTLVLLTAASLPAQQFEVASVKPDKSGQGVRGGCHGIDSHYTPGQVASAAPLGRCVITSARLGHLIRMAFNVGGDQLKGGPDWITGGIERYDVNAEAENPSNTTEVQLRSMLQALLVERFALKYHIETIEQSGFALVPGKTGPKLKAGTGDDFMVNFGEKGKPAPNQPASMMARKMKMEALAGLVSSVVQAPVVDETGLSGDFDIELNWDQENGPAIETALQQQLGLRLEKKKVPVKFFVIESAQKPAVN